MPGGWIIIALWHPAAMTDALEPGRKSLQEHTQPMWNTRIWWYEIGGGGFNNVIFLLYLGKWSDMTIYICIHAIYTHINVSVCIALLLSYFDISRWFSQYKFGCFFVTEVALWWTFVNQRQYLVSSPEAFTHTPYRSETNRAHCIAYLVLVKRMDIHLSIMNMYQLFCLLENIYTYITAHLHALFLKHAVSHCFEHYFAAKSKPPFGSSRSSRW